MDCLQSILASKNHHNSHITHCMWLSYHYIIASYHMHAYMIYMMIFNVAMIKDLINVNHLETE